MTTNVLSPAPEALLAHRSFVRGIVRSLLRGADGEDDVVQKVLLRAWQRPPESPGRLRVWLAKVARNLAIDHLRTRRRQQVADAGVIDRSHVRRRRDRRQRQGMRPPTTARSCASNQRLRSTPPA